MNEPTNADRAQWARYAARIFAEQTNQVAAGDWEHDRRAVYGDLLTDLLHAIAEDLPDIDGAAMLDGAVDNFREEVHEEQFPFDRCHNCANRRYYPSCKRGQWCR